METLDSVKLVITILITLILIYSLNPFVSFHGFAQLNSLNGNAYNNNFRRKLQMLDNFELTTALLSVFSFGFSITSPLDLIFTDKGMTFTTVLSIVNIGLWLLKVITIATENDKGLYNYKVFKYMARKSYEDVMPESMYQLFELYHKPKFNVTTSAYSDYNSYDWFEEKKDLKKYLKLDNTLESKTYDLSIKLLEASKDKTETALVTDILLQPNNIAVLGLITDVISNAESLTFIESPDGSEAREVYIKGLDEIMLAIDSVVTKYKDIDRSLNNKDLILQFNKAKESKNFKF